MIAEIENINFQDRESDSRFKSIMDLSEDLRKEYRGFKLGSDEHLDYISNRTKKLDELIINLRDFNNHFEKIFPNTKDRAEILVKILHILHSALSLAIVSVNKENYNGSFATCLDKLKSENNQLVEYIEDINEFIMSDDGHSLLNDLN